ncbi:competence/damage-inducible protein A [Hazenella sp. IB182357]|uniref:Putative competence-damage inducible protein n=1 Tax=Polycladospora coralii TaxID=2771432 RepID=A0A926NBH9_9BACL|nr:competence/damage-inducible protein A [Polycladospora coralii]MBD1373182.1 competence/damage-inducible protein A [Polycladospora coralii]
MKAEIITVGSELLQGQTIDTHSMFLSQELLNLGVTVNFHSSVRDDQEQLLALLDLASKRSDFIFLCGGLGPTLDDLTKETLATYLNVTLVQDEETTKRLESIFEGASNLLTQNNYKQTFVFPDGVIFQNQNGTAPGLAVTKHRQTYICLPGPPAELRPMFETSVKPFLLELMPDVHAIVSHPLSFFGIGESMLEDRIQDVVKKSTNPIVAPYAKEYGVTLRLTAKGKTVSEAQRLVAPIRKLILERVGEYCYSERDELLEEVVSTKLRQLNKSLAVVESCTGGLLAHLITSVPGSSQSFKGGSISYTNESKAMLIDEGIVERYGAISMQTAEALAEQTQRKFQTHFALSTTGVAGPNESENKPVGLIYIGLAEKGKPTRVYQIKLKGSRRRIQLLTAKYALFILQQRLKKGETIT